jgi:cell division protein FtsB
MKPRIDPELEPPDEAIDPTEPADQGSADRLNARGADLGALPIAGITRRRVAWALAAIVSIWIVAVFARQVGDAGAAVDRAARLRAENAAFASQVEALQQELGLVQQRAFVEQQARAYGLGGASERPFALAPDSSPLPADAPGSASARLGARPSRTAPVDAWLDLLFGPSR